MLPIHTGGHEGDCPEQVLSIGIALVLLVSSLFPSMFPRIFTPLLVRTASGRPEFIVTLLFLASQSSEQRTSYVFFYFFSFSYVVQLVQFYCIKNRLLARVVLGTLQELETRSPLETNGTKKRGREKREPRRDPPRFRLSSPSPRSPAFSRAALRIPNLAPPRARPRGSARLSNHVETVPLKLPVPRCVTFLLVEATYYF